MRIGSCKEGYEEIIVQLYAECFDDGCGECHAQCDSKVRNKEDADGQVDKKFCEDALPCFIFWIGEVVFAECFADKRRCRVA